MNTLNLGDKTSVLIREGSTLRIDGNAIINVVQDGGTLAPSQKISGYGKIGTFSKDITVVISTVDSPVSYWVGIDAINVAQVPTKSTIAQVSIRSIQDGAVNGCVGVVKGSTGVYAPGNVLTAVGGTFTAAAQITVRQTTVLSATITAGGTGGTDGTGKTMTGTTGTGEKAILTCTIAGGIITAITGIYRAGQYTVNPTTPAAEPMTGNAVTGFTANLVMGVHTAYISTPGIYQVAPANPVAVTGGGGSGATFNINVTSPMPAVTMMLSPSPTVFAVSDIASGVWVNFLNSEASLKILDRGAFTFLFTNTTHDYYFPRATGAYLGAAVMAVGFTLDGSMFEIAGRGNDYWQFFVDELDGQGLKLITPYLTVVPTGSGDKPAYIKVNFGSRGIRNIVAIGQVQGFAGVVIEPTATISAFDFTALSTTWGTITDSYSQFFSNAFTSGPFYEAIVRMNGFMAFQSYEASSGYTVGNVTQPHLFIERLPALIAANPSNTLIAGGINDTLALLPDKCDAFNAMLFNGLPNAQHVIIGCWTPPSQVLATSRSKSAAILNSLNKFPEFNWIFIDPANGKWTKNTGQTGYVGNNPWQTGTGHIGATTGNGNSDVYVNAGDTTHPSVEGAAYLGRLIAIAYNAAMNS